MAKGILVAYNFNQNELQLARAHNLASAPVSPTPVKGQIYFNSTDNILYWYNGSGWVAAQGGAGAVPATTVTNLAIGDSAVVGVATTYSREDHKHGAPAFANVTAEGTFGSASNNGSLATVARSDHAHGNPAHDGAAHSAISLTSLAVPTADRSMGGFKVTNVATPTTGTDAPNKDYVDNLSQGLSGKEAVRVATTANGTLASAFQNGASVDGVTLATGNRILIKDQSTGAENGIYTVNASGAPTRAIDADSVGELEGAYVFAMEGTTNADKGFLCTTNAPITPGSTATTWVVYGAGGGISAGAGLTGTSTFDVVGDTSIVVTADLVTRGALTGAITAPQSSNTTTLAADVVANTNLANMAANSLKGNNTGGSADPLDLTVAQVRTLLGMPVKYSQATVGGATSQVITHNLNTRDVVVNVYRTLTPWDEIECDVEMTSVNTITLRFAVAPSSNEYSVVVIG